MTRSPVPAVAVLGLPRIGPDRELKRALEAHWHGDTDPGELDRVARELRRSHVLWAAKAGVDVVSSNDFSLYDHVLDTALMVGAVPERFAGSGLTGGELLFALARGTHGAAPLAMTKWFDTNYHHLVPEIGPATPFALDASKPLREHAEALEWGIRTRPVVLGPVSFLLLSRPDQAGGRPLDELDRLLGVYEALLRRLQAAGVTAVQVDEPCLVRDLGDPELRAVEDAWARLAAAAPGLDLTLATYFGGIGAALERVLALPAAEFHLDVVSAPDQLEPALAALRDDARLSLGVIDGRNVWRSDLRKVVELVAPVVARLGAERLRIAPSCSLLHVPYAAHRERRLDPELRSWLAFAEEKLGELRTIQAALAAGPAEREELLAPADQAVASRHASARVHDPAVAARVAALPAGTPGRPSTHGERAERQARRLQLPELPTTTIGSLPQTAEIRAARRRLAEGTLDREGYERFLEREIATMIEAQERVGLDVLVHGEPERNDMVQYFAERLTGFLVTDHGWVQSYGSRCVKPPVLYGDVSRPAPITVRWWQHAQSCTERPVKAMLTGPVTLLQWSFVRDDRPLDAVARQLALVVGDEARDLEAAGATMIQIDEAALREGLPLRRAGRDDYLRWAVDSFRLATSALDDATQVHAHMCYSEFGEIAADVARMDADVVSIEAARSRMGLLRDFAAYPNQIGPGVYDIHSPSVPTSDEIEQLLARAEEWIPRDRLWVNPDCGLKTRSWEEVVPALKHLVEAARRRRAAARPLPRNRPVDKPVTLSRIYTRKGDAGQTRLADGARVSKAAERVEAYGAVDELNAAIGLVLADTSLPEAVHDGLTRVQNELFDAGADLATPPAADPRPRLRIEVGQVAWLERMCDELNAGLPVQRSFLLPGGSELVARLHLARTICRRAERRTVALAAVEPVNPSVVAYLNRLGDLLFIAARHCAAATGVPEVLWRPGASTAAREAEAIFS
jgi:5-methyltetrahydropteroyltriglutamate--homocysteine methyltransferase